MATSSNFDHKVKRVIISCGELSGDEHAAHLAQALYSMQPGIEIKGMGGSNLRNAGVETVVDSETAASVMGFVEVLGSLGKILQAINKMKRLIKEWKPDVIVLIDFPDFNLRLAKYASLLGVKVLYYISPQVWAWRKGRIEFFKQYIDQIAVIFPFEEAFLKENGYQNVRFVGHPLQDYLKAKPKKSKATIRSSLGFSDAPLLAVFPGSRKSEIKRNLSVMIDGMKLFHAQHPEVQIVLNVAPSLDQDDLAREIDFPALKIVKHDSLEVLQAADAGLLKSGTSNLQAAILGLPFAMFYITSKSSAAIARRFVKLKEYSIVNILRPGTVEEILQENATPEKVSSQMEQLLFSKDYRSQMQESFEQIKLSLELGGQSGFPEGVNTTASRVASMVLRII